MWMRVCVAAFKSLPERTIDEVNPAAIKRQPRSEQPEVTSDGLLNDSSAPGVTKRMKGRKGGGRRCRHADAVRAHLSLTLGARTDR